MTELRWRLTTEAAILTLLCVIAAALAGWWWVWLAWAYRVATIAPAIRGGAREDKPSWTR